MNENDHPAKKIALMEAVTRLITEGHDIRDMTVSDIARVANIGKGTVYEYFESKQQLIVKSFEYLSQEVMFKIYEDVVKLEGFYEKLEKFWNVIENIYAQVIAIGRTVMQNTEMRFFDKTQGTDIIFSTPNAKLILSDIIEEGIKEGVLEKSVSETTVLMALFGTTSALVYSLQSGIASRESIKSFVTKMFVNAFK